jgi:hypothetical protein
VDQRLVRDYRIDSISHPASALYLFLITVADSQGLSFYSENSLMSRLAMDSATLDEARENLITAGLIAYQKPLYQVLALDQEPRTPREQPLSAGQILKQIMGGVS